ncbi:MAG: MFS transporter [Patescibacteria group bacterium]|nr:MFS transporter [Patescibacteria group bacterium]
MFLKKYNIKSRNIPLMYVIGFFGGLLFFLPVLALYFEQSLFSVKNVALIFSIEALAMAVFEIPTGSFSDIFGRKKVIMLYSISVLVALSFLSIGENIFMFVGYAIFNGFAMALSSGNDQAFIYDSLKEEGKEQYYKKVIGTLYALWPLGASIGSIIGGYLAHISLKTPIVYSFIPIVIAFILSLFLKEPDYHKAEEKNLFKHISSSIKVIIKSKQLLILIVGWLILMSLGESMHLLKPLFFEFKEIPLIYFGYFSALIFGLSSLGFYISHSVSEKFGNKRTLIFSLLLALLLTIVATFTHKYVAAFFLAVPSILFGIRNIVIDYLFNKNIPSSYRATINSINSFVSKIGIAIMVPLIGYFADLYNINVAFMMVIGIMFVVPILFLFIKDEK